MSAKLLVGQRATANGSILKAAIHCIYIAQDSTIQHSLTVSVILSFTDYTFIYDLGKKIHLALGSPLYKLYTGKR